MLDKLIQSNFDRIARTAQLSITSSEITKEDKPPLFMSELKDEYLFPAIDMSLYKQDELFVNSHL